MSPTPTCTRCGAPLATSGTTAGQCPRCLLEAGLGGGTLHVQSGSVVAPALQPEELAEHFPELEIQALIGQGGMGAVYRVVERELSRPAALKILTAQATQRPGFVERFQREARAMAALSHPNLLTLYRFGQAGPHCFLLTELVEGADLRQLIRERRLAPRQALSIVGQLCDALQFAHDQGVVHRDIKPENVLVDRRGQVKVLDFGLAKLSDSPAAGLTLTGQAMGTPHYMAPEQWERPLEVDHRADLYSLGVVLYELLTGELPVGRFPLPSDRVAVDVRLDEVVLRSLEKEPRLRYQAASELKTDVALVAKAPEPLRPEKRARRGSNTLVTVLAVLFLLLLGALGVGLVTYQRFRAQAAMAREQALMAEAMAHESYLREQALAAAANAPRITLPATYGAMDDELGAAQKVAVQAMLNRMRYEYLQLEAAHTTVDRPAAGQLSIQIAPFRDELAALVGRWRGDLGRILFDAPTRERLHERYFSSNRFPAGTNACSVLLDLSMVGVTRSLEISGWTPSSLQNQNEESQRLVRMWGYWRPDGNARTLQLSEERAAVLGLSYREYRELGEALEELVEEYREVERDATSMTRLANQRRQLEVRAFADQRAALLEDLDALLLDVLSPAGVEQAKLALDVSGALPLGEATTILFVGPDGAGRLALEIADGEGNVLRRTNHADVLSLPSPWKRIVAEQEDRLQSSVELAPDAEGNPTYVDPEYAALRGLSEEVRGELEALMAEVVPAYLALELEHGSSERDEQSGALLVTVQPFVHGDVLRSQAVQEVRGLVAGEHLESVMEHLRLFERMPYGNTRTVLRIEERGEDLWVHRSFPDSGGVFRVYESSEDPWVRPQFERFLGPEWAPAAQE